jgi:hypothetical protein
MCAEKSEGASYGMEALALGGLTETGLLLALFGHGAVVAECLLLRDERTKPRRGPRSEFGPNADIF